MHIVLLPIEPLEERYSKQWLDWTLEYFNSSGHYSHQSPKDFTYEVLLPKAYKSIQNGQFLDCIQTNAFKAKQLQMAIDWIARQDERVLNTNQTVFLLHDGWFPGIEMLAYIRNAMGYNFRIAACLHAGTWDTHDFTYQRGMQPWANKLEASWMTIYDHIFVATEFHKKLIGESGILGPLSCPISVTGFPIFCPDNLESRLYDPSVSCYRNAVGSGPSRKKKRKDLVVFPHRTAPEKRTALFDLLAERAAKIPELQHLSFVRTKDVCTSKDPKVAKRQYYKLLQSARYSISLASQETWGIAMQESVICGCIPIVPNRLSYKEMYPPCFRVPDSSSLDGEVEQVLIRLRRLEELREYAEEKRQGLSNVFQHCGFSALVSMNADLVVYNAYSKYGSVYESEVARLTRKNDVLDQAFKKLL